MSKKAFFVILGLSVVVTYGAAIIDDLRRGSLLGGAGGLPFRFASGSFLGGSTDTMMLILNIVFWFVVIWVIWRVISHLSGRAGR